MTARDAFWPASLHRDRGNGSRAPGDSLQAQQTALRHHQMAVGFPSSLAIVKRHGWDSLANQARNGILRASARSTTG